MKIRDVIELIRPNHLPANALLFTLGSVIALKTNPFNTNYLTGLISFIIGYGCVYLFNDLMDVEHDKKHECVWKRNRPLPSGKISIEFAQKILIALITTSMILALTINTQFMLINASIILINFTYSKFRLKKNQSLAMPIIALLQVLKITLGWTSITTNLTNAPVLFFITYGLGYTFALNFYKKDKFESEKQFKKYTKIIGLTTLATFTISIIIHPIVRNALINLIITTLIGSIILLKIKDKLNNNFTKGVYTSAIMVALIVISFAITN